MRKIFFVLSLAFLSPSFAEEVKLDRSPAALKRGAQAAMEVCEACHSLKYVKYRDLAKVGFSDAEINALRGENELGSPLLAQMAPEAAKETFGIVPPDLSLMTKAREGGSHYIYSMVTGFYNDSKGETQNHIFPGVKMPDVFNVAAADAAGKAEIEKKMKDVAAFLEWASDPMEAERKKTGIYVMIYLFVLTTLFYLLKKKIWKKVKETPEI